MSFEFKKCFTSGIEIPGLYEVQPKVFNDVRGYFFEAYSQKDFFEAGLTMKFVQDNQSSSEKGVLRGLHFQTFHPQGKLVRVVSGKVYDVVVDLRNESPTFGKYYGLILDEKMRNQLYIPQGFAHGFYVLSDSAIFSYKVSDFYDPSGESGIIWNDSKLAINWNIYSSDTKPLIIEKDKKYPAFDPDSKYFDLAGNWIRK